MSGFKDINKITEKILNTAEEPFNENPKIDEVMTDQFISENTKYETLEEFLNNAPVGISNNLTDEEMNELNNYVINVTNFSSWADLLATAVQEYAHKVLNKAFGN